MAVLGAQL